jgi:2-methylcitrate dehydratase PrpD
MDTQASTASIERFAAAMETDSFTQDICFKYHAACYLTHSAIEATRSLCAGNRFNPQDVSRIDIFVDKGHLRVCNIPEPKSGLEAKFSLRLTAAMALSNLDTASIALFDDDITRDAGLVAFRDKVHVHPHETTRPETVVRIETSDGQTFEAATNVAIPQRDLPLQWQKLTDKFLTLASPVLGEKAAIRAAEICRQLEDVSSLDELTGRLRSIA